jgi:hypothetical protein
VQGFARVMPSDTASHTSLALSHFLTQPPNRGGRVEVLQVLRGATGCGVMKALQSLSVLTNEHRPPK